MNHSRRFTLMAPALALMLGACFEGPIFGPVEARIRFVNAASPEIHIVREGRVVAGPLAYTAASECMDLPATDHGISILFPTRSFPFPVPFNGPVATVFVTTHAAALAQFLQVERGPAPSSGNASLLVLNASGAGTYDVHVTAPNGGLGTPSATGVSNGVVGNPFAVPAGTHRIRLTTAGSQTVAIDAGNHDFVAGQRVVLVVAPPAPGSSASRTFVSTAEC